MKAEAFYLLAMLDYLSKRNGLPKCNEYEEIRRYKLEKPVFPADTELSEKLFGKDAHKEAMDHAIKLFDSIFSADNLEELYDSARSSESDNRVILQAFWRLQKERGSENLRNEIKKF